jgi:hypothetical protein
MCCEFHIGANLDTDYNDCNFKCETIILGDEKKSEQVKPITKADDNKAPSKAKKTVLPRKDRPAGKHSAKTLKRKVNHTKKMNKFFKLN